MTPERVHLIVAFDKAFLEQSRKELFLVEEAENKADITKLENRL